MNLKKDIKVAVITLHSVKNYGSALQTYATQYILERFGYAVEIVNYTREFNLNKNISKKWTEEDSPLVGAIKRVILLPTIKRWITLFDGFLRSNINLSEYLYLSDTDFKNHPITADVYCTGSDQVWNSGWNGTIIKPYFLSFAPENSTKISIAASFGKDAISADEITTIYPFLIDYKYITVRETSGVDVLHNMGINNCSFCLDPTMLLSGKEWRQISSAYKQRINKPYVLVYQLNHNKDFENYALRVAKLKNCELVRLCTRYDQIIQKGKSIILPEVFEFINLIDNAELVLTDSFHATSFCINLNTDFLSLYPEKYSCRLDDILKYFDLDMRKIKDFTDFSMISEKIDFIEVNKSLSTKRDECLMLINSLIDGSNK